MRALIGPLWVLNENPNWGYFDLNDAKLSFYFWNKTHWNMLHLEIGEIWYTYFPEEKNFFAWANSPEGLIKAPLVNYTDLQGVSHRYLGSTYHPVFLENEIRWVPVHMKRANDFSLSAAHFPLTLTTEHQPSIEDAPPIPNLKKRPIEQPQFFTPPPLLPTVIEAQQNIGPQACNLTLAQQSFITQCIEASGHWPLTPSMRRTEKIILCLDLIAGKAKQSIQELPIKQYRDPLFLARLMTAAFYPENESQAGWRTTVGDVWVYINLLLGAAAKKLGHKAPINYFRPPKGSGCYAGNFLANMGIEPPSQSGLTVNEEITYQLIVNAVSESLGMDMEGAEEEYDEEIGAEADRKLTINDCNTEKLIRSTRIIKCILNKQSEHIDLTTKIFNATQACLSGQIMNDDAVIDYMHEQARVVLQNIATERLKRAINVCRKYPDNLQMIQHLAQDIEDIHDLIPVVDSLRTLSIVQRGLLINELGVNTYWIFYVNSQETLMYVFQSTPNTHHTRLIQLFAKEIYQLHARQALNFQEFESLLDTKDYNKLSLTARSEWSKSSRALIDRREARAQEMPQQVLSSQSNLSL